MVVQWRVEKKATIVNLNRFQVFLSEELESHLIFPCFFFPLSTSEWKQGCRPP